MTEPLGSGRRFRGLSAKLAKNPRIKNPDAVAAMIGRKKFGAERYAKLAAKGRTDAAKQVPETRARVRRIKV